MSNKFYRRAAGNTAARAPEAGQPQFRQTAPKLSQTPGLYSPEHLAFIRQVLNEGHPLEALIRERHEKLYAEQGGEHIDRAIETLGTLMRVGQKCLHQREQDEIARRRVPDPDEKPARPVVSTSELIRATMELRRWQERRERIREETLHQAAEDLRFTQEMMLRAGSGARNGDCPSEPEASVRTAPIYGAALESPEGRDAAAAGRTSAQEVSPAFMNFTLVEKKPELAAAGRAEPPAS